jgi:hypothetical protein
MKQITLVIAFLICINKNYAQGNSSSSLLNIKDFFRCVNIDSIIKKGLCDSTCNISIYYKTIKIDTNSINCVKDAITKKAIENLDHIYEFIYKYKIKHHQISLNSKIIGNSKLLISKKMTPLVNNHQYIVYINTPIFSSNGKYCLFTWKIDNVTGATFLFEKKEKKWHDLIHCESYR